MPDTQYFTNIDGKYVKDAEARQQLNDLEDYVESLDQPWQPLQDGYSNFWFELTDDTLSPWLNFSAKTENAVIDWGDGSGEQALTTLTPTHTYSKAGKYVVKVKGVTGIGTQHTAPYSGEYFSVIKNIELNSDVNVLSSNAFRYCIGMEHFSSHSISLAQSTFYQCVNLKSADIVSVSNNSVPISCFGNCHSLEEYEIFDSIATIDINAFNACLSLAKVQIPSTVTAIGNAAFRYSPCLSEIYIEATVPPTLGTNVFDNIASNYIIYVPVGTAETYKSAAGWSNYADHILEEGQQPNRAMLAKFNSAKTDEPQDDMR